MFSGSESITFAQRNNYQLVDAVEQLGEMYGTKRSFIIEPNRRMSFFFTKVTMQGNLKQRDDGSYRLTIDYDVSLSPFAWIILIFGLLFFLIGLLVLLAPILAKGSVERHIHQALVELI